MKTVIKSVSNVGSEGILLHLNKKTAMHEGGVKSKDIWLSWDAISELIFKENIK